MAGIKGYVNQLSGGLPGANVFVSDAEGKIKIPTVGTATDATGFFKLEVASADKYITASYVGYQPQTLEISKIPDLQKINFELVEGIVGEEFVVIGEKPVNKLWIFLLLLAILLILGFILTKLSK